MDERSRTWAFIVYEESAPSDWMEELSELRIPAAVSPLHDADVWTRRDEARNPDHREGEAKKPHWHVILYFGAKKSARQVLEMLEPLGIRYVERVRDTNAYNRYLCHMDDPEKAQYPTSEILRLNGAVCETERSLTGAERHAILTDITKFVHEFSVTEYMDLMLYCIENRPDWATVAMDHTVYLTHVIASNRAISGFKGDGKNGRDSGSD